MLKSHQQSNPYKPQNVITMLKIQIKNRFTGSIIFEYTKENNTVSETVKEYIKQGLAAGKSYADLSSADLRYANLRSANLRYADLRYANLDKRYIQVACIGSSKRMTTYCFDDDIVWCGCFKGTLQEFEKQVNETHKDNEQYLKEYVGFINYLKSLK